LFKFKNPFEEPNYEKKEETLTMENMFDFEKASIGSNLSEKKKIKLLIILDISLFILMIYLYKTLFPGL